MANENVTFSKGLSTNLPEEKVPGRFLIETDTGKIHLEVTDSERIEISPVEEKYNAQSLKAQSGKAVAEAIALLEQTLLEKINKLEEIIASLENSVDYK